MDNANMAKENRIDSPELVASPRRQATALFRGIAYQIWQTAMAWVDLSDTDLLIVEGAEDFDKLTGTAATLSQVKDIKSTISLRSDCVCESLRNYWIARHKNPKHTIKFRLVTTAGFSVEAGHPFGQHTPGLALWNKEGLLTTPRQSAFLQKFLLSDESTLSRLSQPFADGTPSLVEYIHKIAVEIFHREVVRPMQWLSDQPDLDTVRDIVRVKLHVYGESKNLLPRDSDRALAPMFDQIVQVAIREHRQLSREDFRVLFDDATRVVVPVSYFNQSNALASLIQTQLPQTTEIDLSAPEFSSIPSLPIPCVLRNELVSKIAACVEEFHFASIQGATGKGKSTIGILLARQLAGKWFWTNFSKPELISGELDRLALHSATSSHPLQLLLDNFNPNASELLRLYQKLSVLVRLTLERGGQVIVTTQRMLAEPFLRQSNLPVNVLHQVPSFNEEEVGELCLMAGCPAGRILNSWVNIISLQTARHPQLVHAQVKVAHRRQWALPDPRKVLEVPKELADERMLARQLLNELDQAEVELVYRLSLASQPFRKDHAIAAGDIMPPIHQAGDRFEALVGPWIESAGGEYFRLNQLLSRAAEANWTSQRVNEMRVEYAKAVQRTKGRTMLEGCEVLFQAVLTNESNLAAPVLASLASAPIGTRKMLPKYFDWVLLLEEPVKIFPGKSFVGLLFRLLQFRVAVASESKSAARIAEQLFQEAEIPVNERPENHALILASADILVATSILIAPSLLFRCWHKISSMATDDRGFRKVARSIERGWTNVRNFVIPKQSFSEIFFSFVLSRRGDCNYLREFILHLGKLSSSQREDVRSVMSANRFRLFGFVDSAWTHELADETQSWDNTLAVLEEAREAGHRLAIPDLSMIAARGIAAVKSEYLNQTDDALRVLSETAAHSGDGLMIRYQRGLVYYLNKEYGEAYRAWVSTFDHWPIHSEAALYALPAFSNCGAAAGMLDKWHNATVAFERGQKMASQVGRKLDALKFGIDAAYAVWREGDKRLALEKFASCLQQMERQSQTDNSDDFHTTWKIMEHVAVWLRKDSGATTNLDVIPPRAGICSEIKGAERHALVKDAPRAHVLVTWHCLAEAELYAGTGRSIFETISRRPDFNTHPKLQPVLQFLLARRALVDHDYASVLRHAESSHLAFLESEASSQNSDNENEITISSVKSFIEETILCVLLAISAEGTSWDSVLECWRSAAPRMRYPENLVAAVKTISDIYASSPMDIYRRHYSQNASRLNQVVAGLRLAVHPEAKPALRYVALCSLVTDHGFATNMMLSHKALGELTQKAWLAQITTPFELLVPRLTVPAIRSACESGKKGLTLASAILLAAAGAVDVNRKPSTQRELERLSEGGV